MIHEDIPAAIAWLQAQVLPEHAAGRFDRLTVCTAKPKARYTCYAEAPARDALVAKLMRCVSPAKHDPAFRPPKDGPYSRSRPSRIWRGSGRVVSDHYRTWRKDLAARGVPPHMNTSLDDLRHEERKARSALMRAPLVGHRDWEQDVGFSACEVNALCRWATLRAVLDHLTGVPV